MPQCAQGPARQTWCFKPEIYLNVCCAAEPQLCIRPKTRAMFPMTTVGASCGCWTGQCRQPACVLMSAHSTRVSVTAATSTLLNHGPRPAAVRTTTGLEGEAASKLTPLCHDSDACSTRPLALCGMADAALHSLAPIRVQPRPYTWSTVHPDSSKPKTTLLHLCKQSQVWDGRQGVPQ
jgi:hypothetical protein